MTTKNKKSKAQMMASAKKKRGSVSVQKTNPGTFPRSSGAGNRREDVDRITRHINMIVDPCNAELGPNAYRGADGIVSRFRNVQTIGPLVGKSGFMFVYYPAYNAISASNVNPSDPYTFSATAGGPGQTFLLASGSSQRAVAACSSLTYTGTELDRAGIVYSGCVPIAVLNTAKTISEIALLLQHENRTGDAPLEVKWSPSAVEEEYWESGATTPPNSGDRNAIIIIGLGMSATTTAQNFSIVNTLIAEWRPEPGLGLSTPNPSSHDVPGGLEKVRSALQKMGSWWYGAAKTAYTAMNSPTGRTIQAVVASLMV